MMQFENCDQDNDQVKEDQIFTATNNLEDGDSFTCNQQNRSFLNFPDSQEILDDNEAAALINISQVDNLQFNVDVLKVKKEDFRVVNEEEV